MIVAYGENNIGKSYAMQVVYLFLKYLILYSEWSIRSIRNYWYYREEHDNKQSPVEELVMNFARSKDKKVQLISRELEEICAKRMADELFPEIMDSFRNTFGTFEIMLNDKPKIFLKSGKQIIFSMEFGEEKADLFMERKPVRLRKALSEFHKSRNGKEQFDIYVYESYVNAPIQLVEEELLKMRREFSGEVLKTIKSVYFLPASRSGIYTGMNSFGPILAQLSQNRAYIKGTIQIPSISEPVSDYYMQLSDINETNKGHFAVVAETIEKNILKGEVAYNKKSKAIIYKPYHSDLQMEMRDTSSMVSEISPITAFLKYIVSNNISPWVRRHIGASVKPASVIFIEEPEAHLHPQNQIALIKAFAELSNHNVILVLASHSNYIFNQLNNLILEKKLTQDSYSPILVCKKKNKSISIFLEVDELGADDENFADVSGKLLEEREKLIEKLIQESCDSNDTDDRNGNEIEEVPAPQY